MTAKKPTYFLRARDFGPETSVTKSVTNRWRSWASFSHQLWMEKPIEALLVNGFHPKLRHWHGVKFGEDTGLARAWALSNIFVYFGQNWPGFLKDVFRNLKLYSMARLPACQKWDLYRKFMDAGGSHESPLEGYPQKVLIQVTWTVNKNPPKIGEGCNILT